MIPAGTPIDAYAVGQTDNWLPMDTADVRGRVLEELAPYASAVTQLDISQDRTFGIPEYFDFAYTARVKFVTLHSHDSIEDVRSIVSGSFWRASGSQPTVTLPSLGESQGVGAGKQPDSGLPFATWIILALVAVSATVVFVAKRG